MKKLLIGMVDTGVNPWHSHVRGEVRGCRLYVNGSGQICEDNDFSDPVGHGTAVAGVLRQVLPAAGLFVVKVFDNGLSTYPSLLARGILRAAAEACDAINLSCSVPPGPGTELIADACAAAHQAGSILVAAGKRGHPGLMPASLPGVFGVISADELDDDQIELQGSGPYPCRARGLPRQLYHFPPGSNLSGDSLACARVTAHLACRLSDDNSGHNLT
jgi:subtilisin family serine protease